MNEFKAPKEGSFFMSLLNIGWFVALIESIPPLRKWVNAKVINKIVAVARPRPHPHSTLSSYTSWRSLTDKTWSARHLGETDIDKDTLSDWEKLKPVFERQESGQRLCPKSTCLFPAFAQYLTDGFIRTETQHPLSEEKEDKDRLKRNTSNHDIDLCTLYGRNKTQTDALRLKSSTPGERGRLKSQMLGGEAFPPFLYDGDEIKAEFKDLDVPLGTEKILKKIKEGTPEEIEVAKKQRAALFACGGDRVNSVPQTAMINTLLLREHNRLAAGLEADPDHQDWSDDRVFETARMIVIVQFIKVVVEDYINHIAPIRFSLRADPKVVWSADWNRPNWITTEFSLLYRWHALVPDEIVWGGKNYPVAQTFMNNQPLIDVGLAQAFQDMSAQPAGELGPRNTTEGLLDVEKASIEQGRICRLQDYNAYRDYIGRDRVTDFSDISSDEGVAKTLAAAYEGDISKVDFFVGIFSEDRVKNSPLPRTILSMVALDAFSQALTNPLFSKYVYGAKTFTEYGLGEIEACSSLRDLLARHLPEDSDMGFVSFTQSGWKPE